MNRYFTNQRWLIALELTIRLVEFIFVFSFRILNLTLHRRRTIGIGSRNIHSLLQPLQLPSVKNNSSSDRGNNNNIQQTSAVKIRGKIAGR
jgi:hypothetical protein